jgi:K+-sensing histidine kinase KdpD
LDDGIDISVWTMVRLRVGKLFDTFYTTENDGMGAGLAVSRSIIEARQGRLWAVANEGHDHPTFRFSIPVNARNHS